VDVGLGYTMVGVSILVSIYYNVLLAYTIYYLFASFTSRLPWSDSHCMYTLTVLWFCFLFASWWQFN